VVDIIIKDGVFRIEQRGDEVPEAINSKRLGFWVEQTSHRRVACIF
jgi:hypothetical protein